MKQPWLIQRCELGDGKLIYEYMGSTEFEVGDQAQALKRIFAKGVAVGSTTVTVGDKKVSVYMVAAEGFPFALYQPYLQQLADNKLRLKEWTNFDDVVKEKAGLTTGRRHTPRTNAWFDFRNDVLWVLSEGSQKALFAVLQNIKKKWAEKEAAEPR